MIRPVVIALSLALVAASSTAFAEDVISIDIGGEAQGAGKQAKQRALDAAFGKAIDRVLRQMVSKEQRARNKVTIRDEIERRARLYVSSYKILDERSVEGETRLQVSVKIDRDKLRSALAELQIGSNSGAGDSGTRPRVVVLLKYSGGANTTTTFGSAGTDGGAAGRAFADELRAQGFDLIDAAGTRAPLGDGSGGRLPLGDDAALELARQLGAGGAFVVGLDAAAEGRIRGTSFFGAAGKASVRVLDASGGKVVGKASVEAAGFGSDEAAALEAAASELSKRAIEGVAKKVVRHWPPTRSSSEKLEIRIRGAKTWAVVAEIIRVLSIAKGVRGVHALRVDGGRVDLAVDSDLSPKRLAAQIKKARLRRGSLSLKVKTQRVLVKVSGDARYSGDQ